MKLIKIVLFFINIIVSLLTILSYISPYVDPSKYWVFSFFGLIFPALLFSNILFLLLWFIIEKKKLLLSLLVLIIGYTNFNKTISFHFVNNIENTGISVLSFNTNQGSYLYKNKIKKGLLGKFINNQDADILLVQEINSPRVKKEIKENNVYSYEFLNKNIGTGIYSKYPIINSGIIDFKLNTNSCVWSDIVIHNDTIRVYSVHFRSNHISKYAVDIVDDIENDQEIDTKEVREVLSLYKKYVQIRARQVKQVKNHILKSPYPVILGGDFNDPSLSYTYQQFAEFMKDSFVEKGLGLGVSYAGSIPLLRIDNIFVSDELEIIDFKKLDEKYSDHFAIKAKLKFNG